MSGFALSLEGMLREARVMDRVDVAYLDERWLSEDGRIKLLPAAAFRSVPPEHLRYWMHCKARYSLPTVELVEWLRERIAGRTALELGCGNGDLYHHLGIRGTDSGVQAETTLSALFQMMGQVPTRPRREVRIIDAESAVQKWRPEVAIASYLTRRFNPIIDQEGDAQASAYGPHEEVILANVCCYIHIGNRGSHDEKTVLTRPHEELQFPWLVTRGDPALDVIYVWGK